MKRSKRYSSSYIFQTPKSVTESEELSESINQFLDYLYTALQNRSDGKFTTIKLTLDEVTY
jgi:lipoate-protein ligase A